MLILPPDHANAVLTPRRLGTREKWMVGGVLSAVLVVALVVAISIGSSGHSNGNGCVDVTVAGPIGGEEIYQCGAKARSLCASVNHPGGFVGAPGRDIANACRKVGLPVG